MCRERQHLDERQMLSNMNQDWKKKGDGTTVTVTLCRREICVCLCVHVCGSGGFLWGRTLLMHCLAQLVYGWRKEKSERGVKDGAVCVGEGAR